MHNTKYNIIKFKQCNQLIIKGYIKTQKTEFRVFFEVLCKRFNHSNPSTTMRYLGIQTKEVGRILMNEI